MNPAKKPKGITDSTEQTDFTDRSLTQTPPLATSRDDICSTTSGCVKHSTGPNEPDECAVVKDLFAARWAWSAADRGTIRGIRSIGQIRIPFGFAHGCDNVPPRREVGFPKILR